jgi:Flp pilus assembly protein TadD
MILPVEELTPMAGLGLLILLATIVLFLLTPKHPLAGFAAGWFFITILTVSNLLFPIGVVVAERTLYTPSIAVAAIVAALWHTFEKHGLGAYRTIERNPSWKDTPAVLTTMMREHPESYRTAWLMADQYFRRGQYDKSEFYWKAATLLWPRDSQLWIEYANFDIARKNWEPAIVHLRRAIAMHPWVPRGHEYLAYSYVYSGRPQLAIEEANEALRLDGWKTILYPVKALAYEKMGRHDLAAGAWRVAARQKGAIFIYRGFLARALARHGDVEAAAAAADSAVQAVKVDPMASRIMQSVADAVRNGCYEPSNRTCVDPMEGWSITPDPPRNLSTPSQNATTPVAVPRAVPGAVKSS